jgi:hypothetical protein
MSSFQPPTGRRRRSRMPPARGPYVKSEQILVLHIATKVFDQVQESMPPGSLELFIRDKKYPRPKVPKRVTSIKLREAWPPALTRRSIPHFKHIRIVCPSTGAPGWTGTTSLTSSDSDSCSYSNASGEISAGLPCSFRTLLIQYVQRKQEKSKWPAVLTEELIRQLRRIRIESPSTEGPSRTKTPSLTSNDSDCYPYPRASTEPSFDLLHYHQTLQVYGGYAMPPCMNCSSFNPVCYPIFRRHCRRYSLCHDKQWCNCRCNAWYANGNQMLYPIRSADFSETRTLCLISTILAPVITRV